MTYRFVGINNSRIRKEYLELTQTTCQINRDFGITDVGVYIHQRNDSSISVNELKIKTKRKRSEIVYRLMSTKVCNELASKIVNEYLGGWDRIEMDIEVEYDPFRYPLNHAPKWNLVNVCLNGVPEHLKHALKHLVETHYELIESGWTPAITMRGDINYFLSKFCRLLKYI
jgi:hypothetical protein